MSKSVAVYKGSPDVCNNVSFVPGKQYVVEYLGNVPVYWNPDGGNLVVNDFGDVISDHICSVLPTIKVFYAGFFAVVPYSSYETMLRYWSFIV